MRVRLLVLTVLTGLLSTLYASIPALAGPLDEYADVPATDRVECLLRVYIQDSGEDCLS